MAESYRLVFPLPPNFVNPTSPRNRWKWKRAKDAHAMSCLVVIYNAGLKNRLFEHVTVEPTYYVGNRMDPDNTVARLKWTIDALTQQGVVPDDNGKHVTLELTGPDGGAVQHIKRAKAAQGLVFEITPVPRPDHP